jgi:hypothetical protein
MQRPILVRSLALFTLAATTSGLVVTACARDESTPTSVSSSLPPRATRPAPPLSPRASLIRQRAAQLKRDGLTPAQQARVASLKGRWTWVGDMHHSAMQEAFQDPAVRALRRSASAAAVCEAQLRYAARYARLAEGQSGNRYRSEAERGAAIRDVSSRVGRCVRARPVLDSSTQPRAAATLLLAGERVRADTLAVALTDFAAALAAGIRGASDLHDAFAVIDAHVAAVAGDPGVSPPVLAAIAGIGDLAASSAVEWDTYFRPRQASVLSWWSWIVDAVSDAGQWVVEQIVDDVVGCGIGMAARTIDMAGGDWSGSVEDFLIEEAYGCIIGGVAGSLF